MFQLKEALSLPSFSTVHYRFITRDARDCSRFCLEQDWERSQGLAVGRAMMNGEKRWEVVTFSTNCTEDSLPTYLTIASILSLLSAIYVLLSSTHLQLYSHVFDFFLQGSPCKDILMSFSQTFNLFLVLSLYWTWCPAIQKLFSWDRQLVGTHPSKSHCPDCFPIPLETETFVITTNNLLILLRLYLPSLRWRRIESHQNICLWPSFTTCTRLTSSPQQQFGKVICHSKSYLFPSSTHSTTLFPILYPIYYSHSRQTLCHSDSMI